MVEKAASAMRSTLCTWVTGFRATRSRYDAPWGEAPLHVFTSSRTLSAGFLGSGVLEEEDRAIVNANPVMGRTAIRAIHALRSGKHYVAVKGNTVIVEYHSSKENILEVVAYDIDENMISAAVIPLIDGALGEDAEVEPIEIYGGKADAGGNCSGVSIYIALMTGVVLADKTHSAQVANSLATILPHPNEDDINDGIIQHFFALNAHMYKVMSATGTPGENWIGSSLKGLTTSAQIQRLSLVDIMELADDAIALTQHPVALRNPRVLDATTEMVSFMSRDDSLLFSTLEAPSEAAKASSADTTGGVADGAVLAALKAELKLDIHELTKEEAGLVPVLDEHYVVDETLLKAARTIKADWKYPGLDLAPNFILEGDAGSGKTAATKFFAAMFGIPRTKMTMHPLFESSNLIGAFFPVFNDIDEWDISEQDKAALDAVKARVEATALGSDTAPKSADIVHALRRAFTSDEIREDIRAAYGIPSEFDCTFDPDGAWKQLGYADEAPDPEEISREANRVFQDKAFRLLNVLCEQAENGGVTYRFILSELMKAFQNGWLVEIQEAASVLRPGVLTELNSLMELNGRIELPNGSHITRHPDTIVFITTNRDYAGNVDLNESLRDRCMLGIKMDLPPAKVMADRAMAQLGFKDADIALKAAQTVMAISDEAKAKNIRGSFGMRSLLGWMLDLSRGDFSEEAFRRRVIEKMTTRDDDVSILMTCFRANSPFASTYARTGRRT